MLTGFQLRAARGILNLHYKDIAKALGLCGGTLNRLSEETPNLAYLRCYSSTNQLLENFFRQRNLVFPKYNQITLDLLLNKSNAMDNLDQLDRFQLKASRIALNLTQEELAKHFNIYGKLISILESQCDNHEILKVNKDKNLVSAIRAFFIESNIVFESRCSVTLEVEQERNIIESCLISPTLSGSR